MGSHGIGSFLSKAKLSMEHENMIPPDISGSFSTKISEMGHIPISKKIGGKQFCALKSKSKGS